MSQALEHIHRLQTEVDRLRYQQDLLKRKLKRRDARIRVLCTRLFEETRRKR